MNILRLPKTSDKTGLSRSSIYKRVKEGTFPKPIQIGERAVGWLESEVEDWLTGQLEQSRMATTDEV